MHACVSVVITVPHDAPAHVGVVTVRLCVPVRSQPSLNPPHAPQAPYDTVPHDAPSVTRVHASESTAASVVHDPAAQRGVARARVRVPDTSHASETASQSDQGSSATLPHSASLRQASHERAASLQ